MTEHIEKRQHFIRQLIKDDVTNGKYKNVVTRFPPEPNGYLHIGHAKSICLNFSMAEEFNGQCYLRFDDTNPLKEEEAYVRSMIEDIKWLGFDWGDKLTYSSDHYEKLFSFAVELIKTGKAYVDSLSADKMREYRGTLQEKGKDSPYRGRSVDENLQLFLDMKAGKYKEGEHVLRAKIDMGSSNLNMRDPTIYRIRYIEHQRTGNTWCIYPMYDFAHPLSDAIEHVTHSLCTLEFQDHRPLYDWFIDNVSTPSKPLQTEFSRLNLSHTIASKRKLKQLVDKKIVDDWDDPRMPTLSGMRTRGYPPQAIRKLCEEVGVSRVDSVIDMSLLEECVRDELNQTAPRAMVVFNPIKVVIDNYPENKTENLKAMNHPNNEALGERELPFSRELFIERDDFLENPPKKFFRLSPGKEVRLRNAYVIKCESVIKNEQGDVIELRCTYDENTLGKKPEGRKVKGVIHWVACQTALPCQVTLFERLFIVANPAQDEDFEQHLNPHSSIELKNCYAEPSLSLQNEGSPFQFERLGYFVLNSQSPLAFHQIVSLKDTWAKEKKD